MAARDWNKDSQILNARDAQQFVASWRAECRSPQRLAEFIRRAAENHEDLAKRYRADSREARGHAGAARVLRRALRDVEAERLQAAAGR